MSPVPRAYLSNPPTYRPPFHTQGSSPLATVLTVGSHGYPGWHRQVYRGSCPWWGWWCSAGCLSPGCYWWPVQVCGVRAPCHWMGEFIFIYLFIYCHLYSAFSIVQCSNALYRLWDGEIQGHTGQSSVREIDAHTMYNQWATAPGRSLNYPRPKSITHECN